MPSAHAPGLGDAGLKFARPICDLFSVFFWLRVLSVLEHCLRQSRLLPGRYSENNFDIL